MHGIHFSGKSEFRSKRFSLPWKSRRKDTLPCESQIDPPSKFVAILCLLAFAYVTQSAKAQQSQQSTAQSDHAAREAWRRSMKKTPLPKHGCFNVKYPSTQWQEQPCTKAPNIPFMPKQGAVPQSVGNGNDFVAEVTAGLISSAEGTLLNSGGLTTESGYIGNQPPSYLNSFSLQLNSNVFSNTPLCSGASDPSQCLGWQQFVFAEGNSGNAQVFMQYWLLSYGANCPPNWISSTIAGGGMNCYISSSAVSVPALQAMNLQGIVLSGSTANGTDTVMLGNSSNDSLYSFGQENLLNLDQNWAEAEFNVLGDGSFSEANINSGSTFLVQTSVTNGTTNAPVCLGPQGAGTTGETNNLSLIPQSAPVCCPYGGASPSIQFLESNASGATATCGANGLESNIGPDPHSANGSATMITHPIIQGEIRVLYSATLEDSTSGASITYQLFDSCGDSLGGATVSPGTTVSYLDTEINGESCTYGIHGTMYATQPGSVPSSLVGIVF